MKIKQQSYRSPLQYPGGKWYARKAIISYFPKGLERMRSIFFGAGHIELELASKGVYVEGHDNWRDLVNFWRALQADPRYIYQVALGYYPITKEKWEELRRKFLSDDIYPKERAAIFYVLNRCTYSGRVNYSRKILERVRDFYNTMFEVTCSDFTDSIKEDGMFTYLDPPYMIDSSLYGSKYSEHKNFDHVGLRKELNRISNWVLSYNDLPEIRNLYRGLRYATSSWAYGVNKYHSSKEILIFGNSVNVPEEFQELSRL